MRILVTGNLGYIGTEVAKIIKFNLINSYIVGYDSGLFKECITSIGTIGDSFYDYQYYSDIRDITASFIRGFDVVINLAAVSNDPIGLTFQKATKDINLDATLNLARLCESEGVSKFVLASSCSIYGQGGNKPKVESDITNPLTAYAISKIEAEDQLKKQLSSSDMDIIILRFATACGKSDRLRLDLVLNDFVASALKYKCITILSDGSPYRPLIDVKDMAKAIVWAITFSNQHVQNPLTVNIGSNECNYKVKELAERVQDHIKGTRIELNSCSQPDKRSYQVDFSLYKSLAGESCKMATIDETISDLIELIEHINLPASGFRDSRYIRLNYLKKLFDNHKIDSNLRWMT